MSKFQRPSLSDNLYPVNTQVFHTFLSQNGYIGVAITSKHTEFEKASIKVFVPKDSTLTQKQVEQTLSIATLKIEDFEQYINTIKSTDLFDKLIDMSLNTPSLKKKKG
jgi:hypothetical protein